MIIYFADRKLNILGQASTSLPQGMTIIDDLKTEDVETGVAVFEVIIGFDASNRIETEQWAEVGNYILRSNKDENEFYTIIDAEIDTKNQEISIYAEDAGLDLLNEVVGAYEADKAYNIEYYVNKFAGSSGFVVGINEVSNLTRKLSWDGEATVTERLASVATQFDNCEISYSFDIKGLAITKMYINIYRKRGHDIGCQLRINKEVDRIITKKSIANLATALEVTGGTPEGKDNPITLQGYKYDDGDFYVSGTRLCSRKALQKWGRLPIGTSDHVVKKYSYDTLTQSTLCKHAVTELRKICDMEVNYEVDITRFPDNTKIGDRINIIDDAGELYLSTRILQFETSVVQATQKATLGEHLLKGSGISQKVIELAEQFAKNTLSAQKALEIANAANNKANEAQTEANNALTQSQAAQNTANDAKVSADKATQSAAEATQKTAEMQEAVNKVEQSVTSIEKTVTDAKQAAYNAVIAADTANKKADEAKAEAGNAVLNANEAKDAATAAGTKADNAILKADDAVATAGTAKTEAANASATAAAAKADAVQAQKDVDALGVNLETVKNTMELDYARKTDLTATEAKLQTQITQNADTIEQTASKVVTINETANNAKEIANKASADALAAQTKADAATADATAAQTAADKAKEAATAAQTNADNAKKAAADAQAVANKAETDLTAAKNDLATVQGRVDATEQDILAAQAKVDAAQQAADKAKTDAANAQTEASKAQETANAAVTDAANAQNAANDAANKATLAQKAADAANGNAEAAKTKAEQAEATAAQAQTKAEEAVTNAANAKQAADQAKLDADNAAKAASDADLKAQQAQQNLVEAEKNLAAVSSKVDATKEEVDAAQAAVTEAKTAAEKAKTDAIAAQNTANTAKANADKAQLDATNAQKAADTAQAEATAAKKAADKAQADVDALEIRTTAAETKITQNSEAIKLAATKTEVTQTLAGYYTKTEADAAIKVSADNIESTVSKMYATKDGVTQQIGTAITQSEKDLTVKINDAKKTATNYLNFSGGGLIVGDMTKTTLGNNVLIDSDSIDIRNGTNIFASFGANLIELGKNSPDATISLCGGKGSIYFGADEVMGGTRNNLTFIGDNIMLQGKERSGLYYARKWNDAGQDKGQSSEISLDGNGILLTSSICNALEADGSGMWTSCNLEVTDWGINGLGDNVLFQGRYSTKIDCIAGDISLQPLEVVNVMGGLNVFGKLDVTNSHIILDNETNGGWISSKTTDGKIVSLFGFSSSNNFALGYGGYANSIGATNIYGNNIKLLSKGGAYVVKSTSTYCMFEMTSSGTSGFIGLNNAGGTNNIYLQLYEGNGYVALKIPNESIYLDYSGSSTYSAYLRPAKDGKCTLGTAGHRYYRVYAANSSISTSDRREKENIIPLGENPMQLSTFALDAEPTPQIDIHSELFDRLMPVQYNMKVGNPRTSYGLIAQDVIASMAELGIAEDELDLVYHEFNEDKETGEIKETYGIAYENLIAMLIHEVQKLKKGQAK